MATVRAPEAAAIREAMAAMAPAAAGELPPAPTIRAALVVAALILPKPIVNICGKRSNANSLYRFAGTVAAAASQVPPMYGPQAPRQQQVYFTSVAVKTAHPQPQQVRQVPQAPVAATRLTL